MTPFGALMTHAGVDKLQRQLQQKALFFTYIKNNILWICNFRVRY
ncbi:MAG: hypothetical protein R6V18_05410 [Desulfuromonadaceae bacterium]